MNTTGERKPLAGAGENIRVVKSFDVPFIDALDSLRYAQLPSHITDGFSFEVNAKNVPALIAATLWVLPGSSISIPYLPGHDDGAQPPEPGWGAVS